MPLASERIVSEREWLAALQEPDAVLEFHHAHAVPQPRQWVGADDVVSAQLVYFVETGAVSGRVDGVDVQLDAGDVVWVARGRRCQFWTATGSGVTRTRRVRFVLWREFRSLSFCESFVLCRRAWSLLPVLRLLNEAHRAVPGRRFTLDELRGLTAALGARFFDLAAGGAAAARTFDDARRRVLACVIQDRLFERVTPADLARELNLTLDYFSRVFKNTYGLAPRSYLKRERLHQAAAIFAESTLSLKEFCRAIREHDISKFCRQFKQQFGCTPSQYRGRRRATGKSESRSVGKSKSRGPRGGRASGRAG